MVVCCPMPATVFFFGGLLLLGDDVLMTGGRDAGLVLFGNLTFTVSVITVLLRIALELKYALPPPSFHRFVRRFAATLRARCHRRSYWTVFTFIGVFGSILVYLVQLAAESLFPQ